ncbi:hypothetical protein PHSC3_001795 [Chlamydiales bacterium STE3]|nr:hypothetical protein PHSC3_001795 [Chlamydiales bacterium STE3]
MQPSQLFANHHSSLDETAVLKLRQSSLAQAFAVFFCFFSFFAAFFSFGDNKGFFFSSLRCLTTSLVIKTPF